MNYDILIPLLAGISAMTLVGALIAVRTSRRAVLDARLRSLTSDDAASAAVAAPAAAPPAGTRLAGMLDHVGQKVSARPSTKLLQDMTLAGFHSRAAPTIFMGAKVVLLLAGFPLLLLAISPTALPLVTKYAFIAAGAMVLFFLPNLYVLRARERRRQEIREHLPDAIDLLEISVSAGMGLDSAWNSVANEVRNVSPTLADEMALANLEMHLGAPRSAAMRHMAQRTGSEDLASLVAILVQSDRFGTSVSEALRTFATSMREVRSQRAQEYVEKMAVKLIFPMVLFIFPAVVVVMAGPAFMALTRALSRS